MVLPPGFRQLIDTTAISNLSSHFTVVVALGTLVARYSPSLFQSLVSSVVEVFVTLRLATSQPGRRYIKMQANLKFADFAMPLLDAKDKGGVDTEEILKKAYRSGWFKYLLVIFYVRGVIAGNTSGRIAKYSILIQLVAVFVVLSLFYVEFWAAAGIIAFMVLVFLSFPPSFFHLYFEHQYWAHRISPADYLNLKIAKVLSIGKVVVMVLSASFLLGYAHASALKTNRYSVLVGEGLAEEVSIISVTASGTIVYSAEIGFSFRPFERVNAIRSQHK